MPRLRSSIFGLNALLLSAVAFGIALAGCNGGSGRSVHPGVVRLPVSQAVKPPGAPGAGVRFLLPAGGSVVRGAFPVRVAVSGFRLVRTQSGTGLRPGFGHLHFSLDAGRFDQPRYSGADGRLALQLGVNGFYSPAYAPVITYRSIPAGIHTLRVQLVNVDESPTGVAASVRFDVR